MFQVPFLANSPPVKQASNEKHCIKMVRSGLRSAMHEGRWSWFRKLAQSIQFLVILPNFLNQLS
jgi:hypothetical protein